MRSGIDAGEDVLGEDFFALGGEVDAVAFAHRYRFAAFVRQVGGVAAVRLGEEAVGILVVLAGFFAGLGVLIVISLGVKLGAAGLIF